MGRHQLIGGPFDGERLALDAEFALVQGFIYRRERLGSYVFQGHDSWVCPGCNAFIAAGAGAECPLCGAQKLPI